MDEAVSVNCTNITHSRPWIDQRDHEAVHEILESQMVANGAKVAEFERQLAKRLLAIGAVAQASGTASLFLGLKLLGLSRGQGVALPTYVCDSVFKAVLEVGAIPVICDTNAQGVITEESVSKSFSKNIKAIIAVHIFGHPCDINAIRNFGVPVLEDACQAFGTQIYGRMAGSIGDFGILSFNATKCFTTGEGGMLIINNQEMENRFTSLMNAGFTLNPRLLAPMTDLQASLGLSQLNRYHEFLIKRAEIESYFDEVVSKNPKIEKILPEPGFRLRYVLRTKIRDYDFVRLQSEFLGHGIHIRRGVDQLLHRLVGMPDNCFPNASKLFEQTVSIPFYPSLTDDEVSRVCDAIEIVFK